MSFWQEFNLKNIGKDLNIIYATSMRCVLCKLTRKVTGYEGKKKRSLIPGKNIISLRHHVRQALRANCH